MQVNYWIQMDNVLIKLELELKINKLQYSF